LRNRSTARCTPNPQQVKVVKFRHNRRLLFGPVFYSIERKMSHSSSRGRTHAAATKTDENGQKRLTIGNDQHIEHRQSQLGGLVAR